MILAWTFLDRHAARRRVVLPSHLLIVRVFLSFVHHQTANNRRQTALVAGPCCCGQVCEHTDNKNGEQKIIISVGRHTSESRKVVLLCCAARLSLFKTIGSSGSAPTRPSGSGGGPGLRTSGSDANLIKLDQMAMKNQAYRRPETDRQTDRRRLAKWWSHLTRSYCIGRSNWPKSGHNLHSLHIVGRSGCWLAR